MKENAGEILNGGETVYLSGGLKHKVVSLQSSMQNIYPCNQTRKSRHFYNIGQVFVQVKYSLWQNEQGHTSSRNSLFMCMRSFTRLRKNNRIS